MDIKPEEDLVQLAGKLLTGFGLIALPILILIAIAQYQAKKEEEGG